MMLNQIVTEQPVPELEIRGVTDDSRMVRAGALFLAVRGETVDGRDYLPQAIRKGAVAAVCEAPAPALAEIPVIPVERLSEKSGVFASRFYGRPSELMTIVAVTGTNGKTSFTHLLADALGSRQIRCGLIGTMGYGTPGNLKEPGLTTPPAVDLQRRLKDLADRGCEVAVLEASSHGIVQHRLSGCAVDIAVLTNITRDHLDYHGTMGDYRAAKEQLFHLTGLHSAVVNRDDEFAETLISRLPRSVECIDYSANGKAWVTLKSAQMHESGMRLAIDCRGERVAAELPLFGAFNIQNALAVTATLVAMGWSGKDIESALCALNPVAGRMEALKRAGKPTIFVDYAHTPDALEKVLVAVREHYPGSRLTCIFGCGGDRDAGKRPMMGEIASRLADRVMVTSDNPRSEKPEQIIADIVAGICGDHEIAVDRAQAIQRVLKTTDENDIVLVAGKGHENYQDTATGRVPYSDFEAIDAAFDLRSNAIVGIGATGLSYARYLHGEGHVFAVYDDMPAESSLERLSEIVGQALPVRPLTELDVAGVSDLYLSPGVPLMHERISTAAQAGVRIHGDIAMLGEQARVPVIAITGTNGKSTVTHLVYAIIAAQGSNAVLAGNMGTPVLDVLDRDASCYVVEMSSFQLELADRLAAEIAVVLNLSPDHLDRYPDVESYYQTKLALYHHCRSAVINRSLQDQANYHGRSLATFGTDQGSGPGHFGLIDKGEGEYLLVNGSEVLLSSFELKIAGVHNLENVLAALAVGWLLELDLHRMLETVKAFRGLPHRGELVAVVDGVSYINDSKATNPGAMVSAVRGSNARVHLIAGGETKGLDFEGAIDSLGAALGSLAVIGRSRLAMAKAFSGLNAVACESMAHAVRFCVTRAETGDVVLLSPGCASLDQYRNYMERGEAFRDAVGGLAS